MKDSTQRDPILAMVYQLTQQGWPHQRRHVPCLARRNWDFRDKLSTDDGNAPERTEVKLYQGNFKRSI